MLNKTDIDEIVSIVKSIQQKSLIELGCGTGELIEFISEKTDCICYGVENSKRTVEYLNKNKKSSKVPFIYGDMDNEVWNTSEYEIDLVVDSLYFVHDLEKIISNLFKLIKNKRIAIIYYTEYGFNIENENWKDSKTNKLGKVLESKNIKYEYLDITERELGQWEKYYKLNKNLMINLKAKGINLWAPLKTRILGSFS